MSINWSEKNISELELFFSTDVKKGLTREQYLQSKSQYGENIIDSEVLEQQNFYGLKKKERNSRAMVSGSVGTAGVLYFLVILVLRFMDFDVNIFLFLPFYIFLVVSIFILGGSAEKKYENLYKLARPKALVIRQSKRKKVFIENIVPGDIILLSAGDIVPADARLATADYLSCIHINEEGKAVREGKTADIIKYNPTDVPVNIVYAADIVDYGSASAIVIATGQNTQIANTMENSDREAIPPDIYRSDEKVEYSVMQRYASRMSRDLFLASVAMTMLIFFTGIIQERDFLAVILTCLTASAACFSEQIPIIADYAIMYGMHRLSKLGILIKKTSIIDDINNIDTVIAKKTESFTQDRMQLKKISANKNNISNYDITIENSSEIGHILSCMTMCSNVTEYGGGSKNKIIYSGSAIDVAVFEALDKCGLSYDAVSQVYQKIGKTVYNPKNGIKNAVVLKGGKFNLVCFGEAFNILERCVRKSDGSFDRGSFNFYRDQIEGLYKEHDLIMAVAAKDFDFKNSDKSNNDTESDLNFLGFASFSEPKTSAVFESIDYLKKSGVNPVMIADSGNIHMRRAAVKFGIVPDQKSADILDDGKIDDMGDMFYVNADKFRLFTPIALENRIKLLKALKFRKKFPAMTINDIEEISLLNEPCVAFTSVSTETGILKNKASVITNNLTVLTILKTIKNAVLIYRNICKIMHFSSILFISQYLLIILAVLFGGAYILTPLQIIWSGIGIGYIFCVSLCFDEENRKWHILRNKIKEYKEPKKFIRVILKYGFIYGFLIFIFTAISFFACLILKESSFPASTGEYNIMLIIKEYINSHKLIMLNDSKTYAMSLKSAQTSAFITYIVSCVSMVLHYIKGPRFFDLKVLKNKVFTTAFIINLLAVICVVFIPPVRNFMDFGEIGAKIFGISILIGICPLIITVFFRKRIFFERK